MAKLFANSGDPDQMPCSGSALFASYLFTGLSTAVSYPKSFDICFCFSTAPDKAFFQPKCTDIFLLFP